MNANSLGILCLWICLLTACTSSPQSEGKSAQMSLQRKKDIADSLTQKSKDFLHNGDIVLRSGRDVISQLFAQFNKQDKTFSHCGIAFQENGKWVVYHAIGGEDNPDEKLRKDTYEDFIRSEINSGFGICNYPLSSEQIKALRQQVTDYFQQQIPFDMEFDLKSNNRLYCAEMVYKAFSCALHQPHFFATTKHLGFEYVSTDNLFRNNQARILCHFLY